MTNEAPASNKHCGCCVKFVHEWHRHPGGRWGQMQELALVSHIAWCASDKEGGGALLQLGGTPHHREGAVTASRSASSTPGPLR